MKPPSNGITPEVIRDFMPPYHLRADLLEATILALPRPPPDALATWREERLVRLVEEITALRPADAAQARIASQILVVRELGDTLANQAHAADVPMEMCRLSRGAGAMVQTAMGLERLLVRHQKMPVTFYGTVVRDEVDIAALDAVWCRKPMKQSAPAEPTPDPACHGAPDATDVPVRRPDGGAAPDASAPAPVDDAPPDDAALVPAGEVAADDAALAPVGEVAPDDAALALVGEVARAAAGEAGPSAPAPIQRDLAPTAVDGELLPEATGVPLSSDPSGTDVPAWSTGPVHTVTSIPGGGCFASCDLGPDVVAGTEASSHVG